ncbi:hypothetical protein AB0K14_12700 [Actinosynnema sp. NPDC050801]|uniref:hypothetical protein n=1 Tax=unclassified Actinosynnema TaxID=2637065 RepID=UPI0033CCFD2A
MTKDELLINIWLTSVNTKLGRYIVRLTDESVHTVRDDEEPRYREGLVEVEAALARDLGELAEGIAREATGETFLVDDRQ